MVFAEYVGIALVPALAAVVWLADSPCASVSVGKVCACRQAGSAATAISRSQWVFTAALNRTKPSGRCGTAARVQHFRWWDDLVSGPSKPIIQNNYITVRDRPGLCVEPN
jgi:L-alanine-DL-glutamate epimerase-like enolase superfamily enzyme